MIGGKKAKQVRTKILQQQKRTLGSTRSLPRSTPSFRELNATSSNTGFPFLDSDSDEEDEPFISPPSPEEDTLPPQLPPNIPSPTKKNSVQVRNPVRDLVNDTFLLREEMTDHQLDRVWEAFAGDSEVMLDEALTELLLEFLTLARSAAQKQITRQQKAKKHVQQKHIQRVATGRDLNVDETKDELTELNTDVHVKYPAIGSDELSRTAGTTAVKCNEIMAEIMRRGSSEESLDDLPFKQILLDPSEGPFVTKRTFRLKFPQLVEAICSETNLANISTLAPIRNASNGENLNWRPDTLPVGEITVHVEFNFEEIDVPDNEDFNIPPDVKISQFIDHLCVIYPDIVEYREDLEIQIVTQEKMISCMADEEFILEDECEVILLD